MCYATYKITALSIQSKALCFYSQGFLTYIKRSKVQAYNFLL